MMMYSVISVSLLVIVAGGVRGSIVKRAACTQPTQLSAAQQQEALDAHNDFRAEAGNNGDASNEIKLVWNDQLAARAQDWANLCVWRHTLVNECDEVTSVGQNLFMSTGSAGDIRAMVKAWNDEKNFYTFNTGACSDVCGHYTQVVWAKTMEVGCGIANCPSVDGGYDNAVVFACDYSPPGNYNGEKPYELGSPCSECSSMLNGGYKCVNKLCVPCTPATDAGCTCQAKTCQNGGVFNAGQCACSCPADHYGDTCEKKCECVDVPGYSCSDWKNSYCLDPLYRQFMKDTCPVSCGMCDLPDSCFA